VKPMILALSLLLATTLTAFAETTPDAAYLSFCSQVKAAKVYTEVLPLVSSQSQKGLKPRNGPQWLFGHKLTDNYKHTIQHQKVKGNRAVLEVLQQGAQSSDHATDFVVLQKEGGDWKIDSVIAAKNFDDACKKALK
jgi:hypothetical protein